jgi:NAD(P)-dependent dehydrogenase (short-subunit alcohol dehydrogenase family)
MQMSMQSRPSVGRVVLLTGAAGGIGAAITEALLGGGHSIAAVDRNEAALNRLVALHARSGAGERLLAIIADLAEETACLDAVASAVARFGRVDAVINNAGIGVSSLRPDAEVRLPAIEELTAKIWDEFFDINVRAAMLATRAAVPEMKRRGWGRIINNTTSFRTMLRVLPYGATKAALESLSAVWATELAGSGITVNVLIPGGPTDTPFIADGAGWPRDRMLRPQIMGPPARWLISDESDGMTGQRIIAARWDASLSGPEAAARAARAIGWPELAADAVWLAEKPA